MKKRYNLMNFKKFIKSKINESLKETFLDNILDKISNGLKLSKSEQDFLDNYTEKTDEDIMDFKMLSKESTFKKISDLLNLNKKIICNLYDKNGKIGLEILSIENDYQKEVTILHLEKSEDIILKDNHLYNITYQLKEDEYSLETDGEFYEPLLIKNEN